MLSQRSNSPRSVKNIHKNNTSIKVSKINESETIIKNPQTETDNLRSSQLNNESFCQLTQTLDKNFIKCLRRQNLISILSSKQAYQRSDKQNKIIMQILRYQPFFKPISNNYKYLLDISSKIQYRSFQSGNKIYSINEQAEGCYIILVGEVELSIPEKIIVQEKKQTEDEKLLREIEARNNQSNLKSPIKDNQSNNNTKKKNSRKDTFFNNIQQNKDMFITNTSLSSNNKTNTNINTPSQLFLNSTCLNSPFKPILTKVIQQMREQKIVQTIKQGECFGQVSVGQVNRRATNARAKQDCYLIFIRKQNYDLISKASINTEMRKRHQFLSRLQLFKKVYKYSVEGFLYYMTEIQLKYKSYLYKQGDQIKFIYIIKDGEFNQSKKLKGNEESSIESKKMIKMLKDQNNIDQVKRKQEYFRQGIFKIIYPGEIIGDHQIFTKKNIYTESCKCQSQNGTVYKIQKRVFMDKLLSSQNDIEQIKTYLIFRSQVKNKQIQNFQTFSTKNQLVSRMLPSSNIYSKYLKKKIKLQRKSPVSVESIKVSGYSKFFEQFNLTCKKVSHKRFQRTKIQKIQNSSLQQTKIQQDKIQLRTKSKSLLTEPSSGIKQRPQTSYPLRRPSLSIQLGRGFESQQSNKSIPSNIKDIVFIVKNKQNYAVHRKHSAQDLNFSFQKQKVPRFIEQKYKHLIKNIFKK